MVGNIRVTFADRFVFNVQRLAVDAKLCDVCHVCVFVRLCVLLLFVYGER
jgi:hypothetical protein